MILDELSHSAAYSSLANGFAIAFAYLQATDFAEVADGKYPLDDGVFAIVSRYRTKRPDEAVWESHRRHIDVQYVAIGRERFGYASLNRAPAVKTPFEESKDVIFYEPGQDNVTMSKGQFAIFFPQDVHAPGLADGEPHDVLKVVVKVPVK